MRLLKQSDTSKVVMFLMVSSTDHVTAVTGLSPTVTISKNGGAFASPTGTTAEVGSGWYKHTPSAADVGTLGPLVLHATGTGADPVDLQYQVVAFDPYDAVRGGMTALPNAAAGASTGLIVNGANTGVISFTGTDTDYPTIGIYGAPATTGSDGGIGLVINGANGDGVGSGGAGASFGGGYGATGYVESISFGNGVIGNIAGNLSGSVGSIGTNGITAASLATDASAEIADAVWDEAQSGHVSAGTFGSKINSLTFTAANHLDVNVLKVGGQTATASATVNFDDITVAGDFGTQLAAIQASTDLITTQRILTISHVSAENVTLNQGETYSSTLNPLVFTLASGDSWPTDLSGYTITLIGNQVEDTSGNTPTSPASISQTGTVTQATGSSRAVRVDFTAVQTAALTPGLYEFYLRAQSGSGTGAIVDWLRQGQLRVIDATP